MISSFTVESILNKASPALLEQLAEIRAARENLAAMGKLALPASAAAVLRLLDRKLNPWLTIVQGDQHYE
jgi:hypothetical protein